MRLGVHIHTGGSFYRGAQAAVAAGYGAYQYWSKNPRSLALKQIPDQDAAACRALTMARGLASVIHSPYPTNIAGFAPHEEKFALTVASVRNDLEIANACGSLGVVVHVGAVRSHDAVEGYRNVVLALDAVLAGYQGTAQVLLENQAQGLGMALSEILQVRALCQQPQHIALCVDTCHLFASGAWDGQAQAAWMHDPQITPHVAVIHLNDSRYEAGSHRDRHAALGEGYIGEAGLAAVVQQLREVPLVLETPDGKVGVDAQLTRVREWGDVQK